MLKTQSDIDQQYLKIISLHFVKSEYCSPERSCGSGQRDKTSSEGKCKSNNMAVKGLTTGIILRKFSTQNKKKIIKEIGKTFNYSLFHQILGKAFSIYSGAV